MTLPGVDPNDPTPIARRQIILGAGSSGGNDGERLVLLYGNRTGAGTEPLDTIGLPIADDADAIVRLGARSEAYWLYRLYRLIDSDATVYVAACTEAASGTAATCTFTFGSANTDIATTGSTVNVQWGGRAVSFVVNIGDTTATQCAAFIAALTSADEGSWPMTATQGASTASNVATVAAANVGDRGTYVLTPLTVIPAILTGNVITKSSVTNGTGTDDFTAAYGNAITAGEFFYQVSAKTSVTTVTATDNGVGEHIFNIVDQNAPKNGKGQTVYFGLVGTNAQAITTCTSSGANSAYASFFWQKNSPWTPGMLAAYHTAIIRVGQIAHPGANLTNYTDSDDTPYIVPAAYAKSDWASAPEIKAALNNGFIPIAFDAHGTPRMVRQITNLSLNGTGQSDYKCREGHIPSVMLFTWAALSSLYDDEKQPFIDDDLPAGQAPKAKTTYPKSVLDMASGLVDDFTSSRPEGTYEGPILSPSAAALMKKSFAAEHTTAGGGGIAFAGEFRAVEHNIKSEWKLYETSPAQ